VAGTANQRAAASHWHRCANAFQPSITNQAVDFRLGIRSHRSGQFPITLRAKDPLRVIHAIATFAPTECIVLKRLAFFLRGEKMGKQGGLLLAHLLDQIGRDPVSPTAQFKPAVSEYRLDASTMKLS